MKIAVIGTGVSGLVAARILCAEHEVEVFEAANYPGGHANTVVFEAAGQHYAVDTGFMVFNDRTYPNFCRLLDLLEVPSRGSDMSFSVQCEKSGWQYQGSSLNGLFAQRRNLLNPRFYRMLTDIARFNRESRSFLQTGSDGASLNEFLAHGRYSSAFSERYLIPMTAAIWSSPPDCVREFPAKFLFRFLENHGLIQLRDRPQWKTIIGGSQRYVQALLAPFRDSIRLRTPVAAVTRSADHVAVTSGDGDVEIFDAVVMATHADQSLKMLTDADPLEQTTLSAFPYQQNEAILHNDVSLLPRQRRAWASWNYHIAADDDCPVSVTYNLSRLQGIESPDPICLTLNPSRRIAPQRVVRRLTYQHPVFTAASVAAQQRHGELNGRRRTYFCGAYWRNGFHEDGIVSALAVGKFFGKGLDQCKAASTEVTSNIAANVR